MWYPLKVLPSSKLPLVSTTPGSVQRLHVTETEKRGDYKMKGGLLPHGMCRRSCPLWSSFPSSQRSGFVFTVHHYSLQTFYKPRCIQGMEWSQMARPDEAAMCFLHVIGVSLPQPLLISYEQDATPPPPLLIPPDVHQNLKIFQGGGG